MIVLTAYVTLKEDSVQAALESCRKVRAASVLEPGCLVYNFFQDVDDPTRLVFVEEWESLEALNTHFEQDAFKLFFAELSELMRAEPDLRIFDSSRM